MPSFFYDSVVIELPETGRIFNYAGNALANQRLPSDPLFYADLILLNIVPGSRYWIAQASDLSNVLASGVAPSTEVNLIGVPAYSNPMLVEVRVRSASGGTKYAPHIAKGFMVAAGVSIYIAQVEDTIAS